MAYHPSANGMIERWHRTLKTAIMCHDRAEWTDTLPTVLLGLRTSIKDDIKASAAELVYGTTLRGEFFIDVTPTSEPHVFLKKLRKKMRLIRSSPAAHHRRDKVFIHNTLYTLYTLYTCTHVFIRIDRIRKSLESPYEGPYEVTERLNDRVFKINVKGIPTSISIERLKPAFFENEAPDTAESNTASTSGEPLNEPAPRTYPAKKKFNSRLGKGGAQGGVLWQPT